MAASNRNLLVIFLLLVAAIISALSSNSDQQSASNFGSEHQVVTEDAGNRYSDYFPQPFAMGLGSDNNYFSGTMAPTQQRPLSYRHPVVPTNPTITPPPIAMPITAPSYVVSAAVQRNNNSGPKCGKRLAPRNFNNDDEQLFDTQYGDVDERSQTPFIVKGHATTVNQWPWQVFIRIDDMYLCGGALIDDRHVLTTAHCFDNLTMTRNSLSILLGKTVTERETGEIVRKIDKLAIYPDYGKNGSHFDSDIAVVRMNAPVAFSHVVGPICLPRRGTYLKGGAVCTTTGYGDTKGKGDRDDALKQAAVNVISNENCRNLNENFVTSVTKNMLCAGALGGGTNVCQGDPGSPLVCETELNSGVFVLHGLVSFGADCNSPQQPAVYVRVANFVPWIVRAVRKMQ